MKHLSLKTAIMTTGRHGRLNRVGSILISQEITSQTHSFYTTLKDKFNIKIDFRSFIEVHPVGVREFRKQKIAILDYSAIILTSRNAVDHFFRLCHGLKVEPPADMKYFCISEQTSNYLQKYVVVRKRKVFKGAKSTRDLINVIKKHQNEKFLFPCSNVHKKDIPDFLSKNNFCYAKAVMYRTEAADLSDLTNVHYDVIVFFSPAGVDSLFKNFPSFEQKKTRIATFGTTTAKAVRDAGLILDIEAPLPNAPSMTGALELYIKKANGIC